MIQNASPIALSTLLEFAPNPQVSARLVEYAPGCHIALPPHTTYALIDAPSYTAVPGAAGYGYGLLFWQGQWLPLLSLKAMLHADSPVDRSTPPRYALVLGYQRVAREPIAYGAITITAAPQTVLVGDEMQCPLPVDSPRWVQLALSCFKYETLVVPILDTAQIFTTHFN